MYEGLKELRISDSSLALFASCPRKFEFRKIYMHSEQDRTIHTETGKAMHAAYQEWFITRDKEKAVIKLCQEYPWDLNPSPFDQKSAEACYYTLEMMMASDQMLEYEIAEIKCVDGLVRPAVEVPFEIEILGFDLIPGRDIKIIYCGFIDLILLNRLMMEYCTVDVKTHGDRKDDLTAKYLYKPQPLPYALVLQQALGEDIGHLQVNYLSARIHIEDPKIRLYTFEKSMEDLKEWAFDLWCALQQMSMYLQVGKWKRNGGDACMSWNTTCKFFDICAYRDPVDIELEIALFKQEPQEFPEPWIKTKLELA